MLGNKDRSTPKRSYNGTRRSMKVGTNLAEQENEKLYPHNLTYYENLPTESISLQHFEDYAVARLKCKLPNV